MTSQAVIFIPGIGREPFGETSMTVGLAGRLLEAIDRNSPAAQELKLEPGTLSLGDDSSKADFVRVQSKPRGGAELSVDVYALDLPALLVEPYRKLGTKSRALRLAGLLVTLLPGLFGLWRRRGKRFLERVQLVAGTFVFLALLLVCLGMWAVVLASFLETVATLGQFEPARTWLLAPAALITILLANMPPAWKAEINSGIVVSLVAGSYVGSGARKDEAIGTLASLVDKLADRGGYDRVHLISYSFGALLALDAIYSSTASIGSMSKVDSLTTVACPADFIQTYAPGYFGDRVKSNAPRRWINIFEPTDLMASNFILGDNYAESVEEYELLHPEKDPEQARHKVTLAGIGFRGDSSMRTPDFNLRYSTHGNKGQQGFLITAAKRHRVYWAPGSVMAASVFDSVVQLLNLSGTNSGAAPEEPPR
jgi:hypothetical protein